MTYLLRRPLLALALFFAVPIDARAACNLIPGTEKTFGSALGATNRPFAAPGERLELRLRSCDTSSGFLANGTDHVVTLAFKPKSGVNRVVVLAADCGAVDLAPCSGAPGVVSATCVQVTASELQTRLSVDQGDRRLAFTFPDTDAILAPDGDDATLSGPVAIGVTAAGAPLACGLATGTCAGQSGLIACVDQLYANDGACGRAVPDARFASFTALPPPNDFQADCFREGPPCTATAPVTRAAVDSAGNLLIPMGWGGAGSRRHGAGTTPDPRPPGLAAADHGARSGIPALVHARGWLAAADPRAAARSHRGSTGRRHPVRLGRRALHHHRGRAPPRHVRGRRPGGRALHGQRRLQGRHLRHVVRRSAGDRVHGRRRLPERRVRRAVRLLGPGRERRTVGPAAQRSELLPGATARCVRRAGGMPRGRRCVRVLCVRGDHTGAARRARREHDRAHLHDQRGDRRRRPQR